MVADRVAFRLQPPQHTQRAVVAVQRGGALTVVAVVELQVSVPAHGDEVGRAGHRGKSGRVQWPRWAQPVKRRSSAEKNSYINIAIAPTTTRPAKARPICMLLPALTSR